MAYVALGSPSNCLLTELLIKNFTPVTDGKNAAHSVVDSKAHGGDLQTVGG